MNSPHLPPKSCNVVWYRRLQSLPGLLVVMALSGFVGVTSALTAVGWIIPSFIPSQAVNVFGTNQGAREQANPSLLRHVSDRRVNIFDKRKKIGLEYYNIENQVAEAALLSSDGWAVLYSPEFYFGQQYNWEVLDTQGAPHAIEQTVFDSITGLVYLKLSGNGFRIFSLPDWNDIQRGTHGWAVSKDVAQYVILDTLYNKSLSYSSAFWKQQYLFDLSEFNGMNSIVINEQGSLLGLSDEKGRMIPGFWISEHIRSLLSTQQLHISGVSVLGKYVDVSIKKKEQENIPFLYGFYITQYMKPFKIGDVVVRIDNKSLDPVFTPFYIFSSPENINITVLRSNELIEIQTQKKIVR